MRIALKERTEEHVRIYFEKTKDPEIQGTLPQSAVTLEQALDNFRKTLAPGATSYGRTVYADGVYVGDVWCYCICPTDTPQGMISYCLFEKGHWGKGIMTEALRLFLLDLLPRYQMKNVGAFTFSSNLPSIRVLEKNGFQEIESFVENNIASKYFELEIATPVCAMARKDGTVD